MTDMHNNSNTDGPAGIGKQPVVMVYPWQRKKPQPPLPPPPPGCCSVCVKAVAIHKIVCVHGFMGLPLPLPLRRWVCTAKMMMCYVLCVIVSGYPGSWLVVVH